MSVLSRLADACPKCYPGDFPAVLPFLVARMEDGTLRAWYRHLPCGESWNWDWDSEASGWPLPVQPATPHPGPADEVAPEWAAYNRAVLRRELDLHDRYHRKAARRPQAGAA